MLLNLSLISGISLLNLLHDPLLELLDQLDFFKALTLGLISMVLGLDLVVVKG